MDFYTRISEWTSRSPKSLGEKRSQFPKGYALASYKMRQILGGGGEYGIDSFIIQAIQLGQLKMQNKVL